MGFIGGTTDFVILQFQAGFESGVAYVDPEVEKRVNGLPSDIDRSYSCGCEHDVQDHEHHATGIDLAVPC